MIIGSICLVVVLLEFTSGERTSLLSLARRALLPYIVRNQQHAREITPRVSLDEFADTDEGSRNLGECDVYELNE